MDKNNFKIDYTKYDTYALAVKFKNITEDLTKAFFTVKENPDDKPIIQKSLGFGISKISDKPYKKEKTYKLQLNSVDSKNFDIDVQYLYDLQVTIGGVVKTVISGFFVVRKSISDYPNITTQEYDVEVADEVETEFQTTPATVGVEYELDPVATEMIGDLSKLETETKTNLVNAINNVNTKAKNNATENENTLEKVNKIISGETTIPNSMNSTNSTNSMYCQYASTDKSKGTIEERLTALGFKEGTVEVIAETDGITVPTNKLTKTGKRVLMDLHIKNTTNNAITVSITIPEGFRPKDDYVTVYADTGVPVMSGSAITVVLPINLMKTGVIATDMSLMSYYKISNVGWETD